MAFQPGNRSTKLELQREKSSAQRSRQGVPPQGQIPGYASRPRRWTDHTQGLGIGLLGTIAGLAALFGMPQILLPICAVAAGLSALVALLGRSGMGLSAAFLAAALSAFGFATHPAAWSSTMTLIGRGTDDDSTYRPGFGRSAGGTSSGMLTPGSEEALQQATAEATRAETECRHRREIGELKTYRAAALCVNDQMIPAYRKAGYRYMDLMVSYAAKRMEIAQAIDAGSLTDSQAATQLAQFFNGLVDEEHKRDHGDK